MSNPLLCEFRQVLHTRISDSKRGADKCTTNLLFYIFAGTRGGITRLCIIMKLLERPRNHNQLAKDLGIDYKAIKHHMSVLEHNNMVLRIGDNRYGAPYCISDLLEMNLGVLDGVIDKLSYNMEKRNRKKFYY